MPKHMANIKSNKINIVIVVSFAVIASCIMATEVAEKCPEIKIFSKKKLIADTIQLSNILENSHPDPYINGGGKIAFQRRLHQVIKMIPDGGMKKEQFFCNLLPLIASIGDSHTSINLPAGDNPPSGLPLKFKIVDEIIYVAGIPEKRYRYLIGAKLVSIEDIQFSELVARQKKLKGFDNKYANLNNLQSSLSRIFYLKALLPKWRNHKRIKAVFELISGRMRTEHFNPSDNLKNSYIETESHLRQFNAESISPLNYGFLGPKKEIAWLKIADMWNYRENFELMLNHNNNAEEIIKKFYQKKYMASPDGTISEIMSKIPSATDTFRDLVKKMKDNATDTLIVDLRDNPGGNSYMRNILLYFLYGKQNFIAADMKGYQIKKYSDLYHQIYNKNSGADVETEESMFYTGYDFSGEEQYYRDKNGNDSDDNKDTINYYLSSSTFKEEWDSGEYAGYYQPSKVMVICSGTTFSAAFDILLSLWENKAVIIGSPSGQSANCFIDRLGFKLKHTEIEGGVSFKKSLYFPDDPINGNILMPDHELTYDKLASYNFDPNAEVLLALEIAGFNSNIPTPD